MTHPGDMESWGPRLTRETFVRAVEFHDELPSTNDRGMVLARDSRIERPCLIVADRQTAGRGRGSNQWWASDGALTFTLVISLEQNRLPTARLPELSLTAGTAVCVALSQFLPAADVRLKWPNDVYLSGRKVCGILIEVPANPRGQVVVGIGLNINNRMDQAPAEIKSKAISLCEVAGQSCSREDVLIAVLQSFEQHLNLLCDNPEEMRQRWRKYDLLTGLSVTVGDEHETVSGTCEGIDDDGSLMLRTQAGPRQVYGGVVQDFFQ